MISVGILGVGGISKQYINAIGKIEELSLHGVYDVSLEAISNARLDKAVKVYKASTELASCSDMIIICSPTVSHYQYLKEVLQAGVPYVVCEKPICSTVSQALEIKKISSHSPSWVTVSYNLRFLPAISKIKELVNIERVCSVELSLVYERGINFRPGWREDASRCKMGGAAGDLGCHLLDLVSYLSCDRVSLNKESVVVGYDQSSASGKTSEGYFEAYGTISSGGSFRLLASKIGAHVDRGFKVRVNTNSKTLFYSSKNPGQLFLDKRDGSSERIAIECESQGPEDQIMAGWTSSFNDVLRSNIAKNAQSADISTACDILEQLHKVL